MFDIASSSAGASISVATSHDDENPPENIIDGWDALKLMPQMYPCALIRVLCLLALQKICTIIFLLIACLYEPVELADKFHIFKETL